MMFIFNYDFAMFTCSYLMKEENKSFLKKIRWD
jgi:hypothetical protein